MTNLTATPVWGPVYRIETTDRVLGGGGPDDIANKQAQALLNNSKYLFDKGFDIKDLGAIGDGTIHTLQEWVTSGKYANLVAIQVDFPNATALTDSIDGTVIQRYIDLLPLSPEVTINPKGYMNGGIVRIPRGRYAINKRITLKRGVRIIGESRESSQLLGFTTNGLLYYSDRGRYLPDEICIENVSLWQDSSVTPTSGAGIHFVHTGLVPEASISVKLDNLILEGFYNNLILGDGINVFMSRVDQSKAVAAGCVMDSQFFTTSSTFAACYAHSNGGSGWVFNKLYYVDISGLASDSNTGYGYEFINCRAVHLRGGAEANTQKAVKIKDSYGMVLTIGSINNLAGAVDIDNSYFTTLIGGMLTGATGTAIVGTNGASRLKIIGCDFENNYLANRVSGVAILDDTAVSTAIQSNGVNWQIGTSGALQNTAQFQFAGTVDAANIMETQTTFAPVAAPSGQYNANRITWRGLSTGAFPIAVGQYISNALVSGSGGTVARKIGAQFDKQTGGTSANASLYLSMGSALAVGNWSIFNDVDLPSYFKDKLRFGAAPATAPYITSGAGVPSDSTAPTGSIYTRTDGGANTTLYIKEPSGWVPK